MASIPEPLSESPTCREVAGGALEATLPATGPDVTLLMRRFSPPRVKAALRRVFEAAAQIDGLEGDDVLASYGMTPAARADPKYVTHVLIAIETALETITGWRGVVVAGGAPAPVNRETLIALLSDPGASSDFCELIVRQAPRLRMRGAGASRSRRMPLRPPGGRPSRTDAAS